CTSYGSFAYW
nr:immunoglobulin heavy chain junction region [Mus musculus]MBK4198682.1 immunoglobulin heavy chain junction region [Mus musculus]MBK4198683.1 immunoglobulin heavy chain junction region [Mus musculus]